MIMSLGKSIGLEVDDGDINEISEEHEEELLTEVLKKLQTMQYTILLLQETSSYEEINRKM